MLHSDTPFLFNRLFWPFKWPFYSFKHPFCPNNKLSGRWPTVYRLMQGRLQGVGGRCDRRGPTELRGLDIYVTSSISRYNKSLIENLLGQITRPGDQIQAMTWGWGCSETCSCRVAMLRFLPPPAATRYDHNHELHAGRLRRANGQSAGLLESRGRRGVED